MLTSTYMLVALSVEQARARADVKELLERWRPGAWWGEPPALRQYAQACEALCQVLDGCHWRKLDKFVLPALRRCGPAAQALLAELDDLSRGAAEARCAAETAAGEGDPGCLTAIERCCLLLLERLEREERELMPLARGALSGEVWFAIANQMLAHDARQHEVRGGAEALRDLSRPPPDRSAPRSRCLPLAN